MCQKSGTLYKKFAAAKKSLPSNYQTTCLAFHGTPEENIDSICTNGYNSSKRKRQMYGPGEYFATTPKIPLKYCKGGKKLILNELFLGKEGVHYTKTPTPEDGDIIVMKDPDHDLPRFVITFH